MRILHIVATMDPRGGGPQEVVRMLVACSPTGVSQEIATLDDPASDFARSTEVPLHALGSGDWYSPRLMPWLRTHHARFDGVILHGLWGFVSIATLHTIAGYVPYLVFPHGMLDPYFKRAHPLRHLKKWPFWLLNEYWLLRGADRVLFTTATERDLAPQSFPLWRWRSEVTPIGTDPPPLSLEARETFFERCPEIRERQFLLFLGRIHPKKGCDLLVQAFAELGLADPALDLVVAGPDPEDWRRELDASAKTLNLPPCRIHWPGMLQGPAKWGALAACQAFILPSHQENFGIAVVEALACGRPTLLTHPINIAGDLEKDGCAYVEPDTLDGVRSLLARWLTTPAQKRAAMGECALATFAQRYDMRRNAARIFEVLRSAPAAATTAATAEVR